MLSNDRYTKTALTFVLTPSLSSCSLSFLYVYPLNHTSSRASQIMLPTSSLHSTVQIPRHSTPQLPSTLASNIDQILQIITSSKTHLPDEILCCSLDIAVVATLTDHVLFRSTEVSIAGDGGGAFETLQALFGFGLSLWVEVVAAEELI